MAYLDTQGMGKLSLVDQVHFSFYYLGQHILFIVRYPINRHICLYFDLECDGLIEIESCTASSQSNHNSGCNNVISGEKEWEIKPTDIASPWIQIFLQNEYDLRQLWIEQSKNGDNQFSEIDIEFSDGSSLKNYELPGNDQLPNRDGWNIVILPIGTRSQFVKIIRKRIKGPDSRGGLAKLKVFGCLQSNFDFNQS